MINANELRIGIAFKVNWSQKIRFADWMDIRDIIENRIVGGVSGIPLLPEWLEMAGFELQPLKQSIYVKRRLKVAVQIGSVAYFNHEDKDESYYIGAIQFVHQLQNLYFAITGEELTFKPAPAGSGDDGK